MTDDVLQQIQALQYSDKAQAEALLIDLIREMFALDVVAVELRPLAVSLNSFNGFLTLADGQRLFFKTHTEPDSVIGEYYNTTTLANSGYEIIKPVYSSTEWGKQLLIYELIEDPSVFDVAWAIEQGESDAFGDLKQAQNLADQTLLARYRATMAWQSADEAAEAKVHQLFYHRLTGGRLARFYGPLPGDAGDNTVQIALPDGSLPMTQVRQAQWTINGQHYAETLDDLIQRAIRLLDPAAGGTGHCRSW